jgi:hypothetical protein
MEFVLSDDIKIINDIEEITKILDKFLKFKTKISISQQTDDGTEVSIEAEVKNVNVGTKEIYLRPTAEAKFDPEKAMLLVFNNGEGNMEFESEPAGFMRKTLAKFHFPTSIKMTNLRMNDRITFKDPVVIPCEVEGHGEQLIEMNDITHSGMGASSNIGSEIFTEGNAVSFKKFGNKELVSPLKAKVVYCKDAQTIEGKPFFKIGIRFDETIDALEDFISDI